MLGTPYKLIAYLILVVEVTVLSAVFGKVVSEKVGGILNCAVEAIESASGILNNG